MTNDNEKKDPLLPDELPAPKLDEPLDDAQTGTQKAVEKTLNEAREESPKAKTLQELIEEWESAENPPMVDKLRRLKMILMLVRDKVDIDPSKVLIRENMPGDVVGQAHGDFIEIDEILFSREFTADRLTILRHALLHESIHLVKKIDNEGLTEIAAADFSHDVIRDYKHLVQNVAQVTTVLDKANLQDETGIEFAVRLYSEERYDKLYEEFAAAYNEQNPTRIAKDPGAAYKVFQLAFPELVEVDGKFGFDRELVNQSSES